MKKKAWESKTIQGIVLAIAGYLWGLWTGDTTLSKTLVAAGVAWTGLGFRFALK